MKTINMYQKWLDENLNTVEEMREQVEYWENILKKRAFDLSYSKIIMNLIRDLSDLIHKDLDQCHYYLNRIKEMRDAQISQLESGENPEDAGIEGAEPGDPDNNAAGIEQEDLGSAPEEDDDNWSEDI